MTKIQRLDKYLANLTGYSRKEIGKILKEELIQINGEIVTDGSLKFDFEIAQINSDYIEIPQQQPPVVIVLNKPIGFECSTDPDVHRSVYSLLPIEYRNTHFSIGRLDVDTSGLICFTSDGKLNHYLSSPKHLHRKTYRVKLEREVDQQEQQSYIMQMSEGILLRSEEKATLPAELTFTNSKTALLTIYEGKYHQVRRMFSAVGNRVIQLERVSFGSLSLQDLALNQGECKLIPLDEFKELLGVKP